VVNQRRCASGGVVASAGRDCGRKAWLRAQGAAAGARRGCGGSGACAGSSCGGGGAGAGRSCGGGEGAAAAKARARQLRHGEMKKKLDPIVRLKERDPLYA
jgi:hypothetical protein